MKIFLISALVSIFAVTWMYSSSFHEIPEGFVGIYHRYGALLPETSSPGSSSMLPFTKFSVVQVTLQTDEIANVPCGTNGGVIIYFEKIEVVNILHKESVINIIKQYSLEYEKVLIYDKIHHLLNIFCSKHSLQDIYINLFDKIDDYLKSSLQADLNQNAPGLYIQAVRVTKPKIPETLKKNFELMEVERTKYLIAVEKQKVLEKEAETERKMAVIDALKNAEVAKIQNEQKFLEKESLKKMSLLENEMLFLHQKTKAESEAYTKIQQAEGNKKLLTPEYLELKKFEAFSKNFKLYFGSDVPKIFMDSVWTDNEERSFDKLKLDMKVAQQEDHREE